LTPLLVNVLLNGSVTGPYRLELFAQDGRLLYRQVWAPLTGIDSPVSLFTPLDFEIPGVVPEDALLVVTRLDSYHRPQAVSSVDLLLQPAGTMLDPAGLSPAAEPGTLEQDTLEQGTLFQAISIQSPPSGSSHEGGTLLASGTRLGQEQHQLFTQLVTQEGRVVGQRIASLGPVKDLGDGSVGYLFSVEIPYKVSTPTPVRLLVFEDGSPFSTFRHLASVELELLP